MSSYRVRRRAFWQNPRSLAYTSPMLQKKCALKNAGMATQSSIPNPPHIPVGSSAAGTYYPPFPVLGLASDGGQRLAAQDSRRRCDDRGLPGAPNSSCKSHPAGRSGIPFVCHENFWKLMLQLREEACVRQSGPTSWTIKSKTLELFSEG